MTRELHRAGRAARRRLLLLCAFLLCGALSAAAGQSPAGNNLRVEGRVEKAGTGQPGIEVTLHRVTRDAAGVIGTARSGSRGEFTFSVSAPDTSGFTVHFTTVDFLGVRYFGPALHPGEAPGGYRIEVFDTAAASSLRDSVRIARREMMLLPAEGRGWEVSEIVLVRNEARRTLVSADGFPTWEFLIPEDVTDFEIGESEIAPDDLRRMDSRVFVVAPLQPGTREIFLRYRLPADQRTLELPAAQPTERLNLYVQQPSPPLEVVGLESVAPMSAEGVSFLRYSAAAVAPGAQLRLSWREAPGPPLDPAVAAIALALLVLALGAVAALRRRDPADPSRGGPREPQEPADGRARPDAVAAAADQPPL